ncbi:35_t:CDS:2, partial [Acaulospora morrowiae]
ERTCETCSATLVSSMRVVPLERDSKGRILEIDPDILENVIRDSNKRIKFMKNVKIYNDLIGEKNLSTSEDESSESISSGDVSSDSSSNDELDEDNLNESGSNEDDKSNGVKTREKKPYNNFVSIRYKDISELNPELSNQDIFKRIAEE